MSGGKLLIGNTTTVWMLVFFVTVFAGIGMGIDYPDVLRPGEAEVRVVGDKGLLSNNVLEMEIFSAEGKALQGHLS